MKKELYIFWDFVVSEFKEFVGVLVEKGDEYLFVMYEFSWVDWFERIVKYKVFEFFDLVDVVNVEKYMLLLFGYLGNWFKIICYFW